MASIDRIYVWGYCILVPQVLRCFLNEQTFHLNGHTLQRHSWSRLQSADINHCWRHLCECYVEVVLKILSISDAYVFVSMYMHAGEMPMHVYIAAHVVLKIPCI